MNYFLALCLIATALASSVITVPPETEVSQISVRIGEYKEITTPPTYPFESIYSKHVFELDESNNQQDFQSVCHQVPANILFTSTFESRLHIYDTSNNKDVITSFEEIKADRRILDTILFNNKAYLFLKDNNLLVFNTQNHNESSTYKLPSLAEKQSIETGFFVQINDSKLILATRYEAFLIGDEITRLDGYQNFTDLESARDLFGSYFAICGIRSGVVIYSLQNNTLTKKLTLNSTFFNRDALFVSDLAYNPDKSEIFVSDLKFGINIVSLNSSGNDLKATLSSMGYRKVGCNVIVYVDGNLYASCDDLFKVRYSTDEAIIDMPNPMFRVKELLVYKGLIVAVGEDLLVKYYNDKLTEETPQFDNTQRLIFYSNNRYLMANYYGIQAGTFSIKYPAVQCSTTNESMNGIVNAVIKTKAECSNGYFNKHSISLQQTVGQTDVCLYSSPVQFIFWKSEEFSMDFLFITMGVLFLVAAIITTWAIFIYNKEVYLRRTLDMYTNPNAVQMVAGTQIQGYNVMMEENKESENEISDTHKELEVDRGTHSID